MKCLPRLFLANHLTDIEILNLDQLEHQFWGTILWLTLEQEGRQFVILINQNFYHHFKFRMVVHNFCRQLNMHSQLYPEVSLTQPESELEWLLEGVICEIEQID